MHRTFGARHHDGGGMHLGGRHGMAIRGGHGFGRGGPHHGFGRGFGMGGPGFGFWEPGSFLRGCPPPRYGYHGYYYNYPGLVVGTAIIGGALVVGSMKSRHNIYVRHKQQLAPDVVFANTNVKKFYIDIPTQDVYPGETFRVVLDGEEMILTCPDVSGPGERVIISVEQPPQPIMINETPHVVRSQAVLPTHGQVVRGESYPTATIIRCEPVVTPSSSSSFTTSTSTASLPQGSVICIPGTNIPAQFVVGMESEELPTGGHENETANNNHSTVSSHQIVYDASGFASFVIPNNENRDENEGEEEKRGEEVIVVQADHISFPPPPINTTSLRGNTLSSGLSGSGSGSVASSSYPLGTPVAVWVTQSPTITSSKKLPTSRDQTHNVISCPQCTFYNPSVAKHCEICNSLL